MVILGKRCEEIRGPLRSEQAEPSSNPPGAVIEACYSADPADDR